MALALSAKFKGLTKNLALENKINLKLMMLILKLILKSHDEQNKHQILNKVKIINSVLLSHIGI